MPNQTENHYTLFLSAMIPAFGVAGNFTGHLEQAGEAADFANMKTQDANAPKAVFPTFIPRALKAQSVDEGVAALEAYTVPEPVTAAEPIPEFLHTFPFDSEKIIFPKGEQKVQIEPECALIFQAVWDGDRLKELKSLCFGASNDCSIRKEGAKKISLKKNWGASSKGLSENLIPLEKFSANGIINEYRIASFLIRGGEVFDYGEDSAVRDYSYIYGRLTEWLLEKFNNQQDEGPAENIHSYLVACDFPQKIMVSIGATRYTQWGQENFLHDGDTTAVVVYPEKYSHEEIRTMAAVGDFSNKDISALVQRVVV